MVDVVNPTLNQVFLFVWPVVNLRPDERSSLHKGKHMFKKFMVAAAATVIAASASAEGYVGGAFGVSKLDFDCAETLSCDTSDTVWKLYGGYKINPGVAVEAGYVNFGETKYSYAFAGDAVQGKLSASAFTVGVAVHGDMTPKFSAVGRIGLAMVKAELTESLGSLSVSESDTNARVYLGVGVAYAVTPEVKVTADLDFTDVKLDGETGNVRALNVGLMYKF